MRRNKMTFSVVYDQTKGLPMVDINSPEAGVEVRATEDGSTLWVNVDGKCALRICGIQFMTICDDRQKSAQMREHVGDTPGDPVR